MSQSNQPNLHKLFKTSYGDSVFSSFELAKSTGKNLVNPINYTVSKYTFDSSIWIVVTTNKRASEFAKMSSDFVRIGSFLPDGSFFRNRDIEQQTIEISHSEAYDSTKNQVKNELKILLDKLTIHKDNASKHPQDYGYIGDLEYVLTTIKSINEFLQ